MATMERTAETALRTVEARDHGSFLATAVSPPATAVCGPEATEERTAGLARLGQLLSHQDPLEVPGELARHLACLPGDDLLADAPECTGEDDLAVHRHCR